MTHITRLNARSICTAIGLLLAALFLMPRIVCAEVVTQTYHFERPILTRVTLGGQEYDRIVMHDAPNSGQVGHPALPARGARLLLPEGHTVDSVDIQVGQRVALGEGFLIEPAGAPFPLSTDPALIRPPAPDQAVYSRSGAWPESRYVTTGVQSFRGYPVIVLKLQPVEYVPAAGELTYFTDLTVIVFTSEGSRSSSLSRGLDSDRQVVARQVDNPDMLRSHFVTRSTVSGYDLLIITTPDLGAVFEPLKAYHDSTGTLTEIRTTTDIGSTDPAAIRDYITERYLTDNIQYVLIGGDDHLIPARDLYCVCEGEALGTDDDSIVSTDMPGDIYYSCLDGTWNADGDSRFGERTDGEGGGDVDLLAEVYVGRAAVDNATEAQYFVDKTLHYARTNHPYLANVLLAAERLGFSGTGEYGGYACEELIDGSDVGGYSTVGLPNASYSIERLYDMTYEGYDWPYSEIKSHVNGGLHILNHYGHCNYDYALKMQKTIAVAGLTNTEYPFLYSQGCNAGGFDQGSCWAEYFTVKTEYAAFAAVMNVRYGLGDYSTDGPSQRLNREFWDAVFNPAEDFPQLGRANADSKEDNVYRIDDPGMRWCIYEATVFGDPSIALHRRAALVYDFPEPPPTLLYPDSAYRVAFDLIGIDSTQPLVSAVLAYRRNGGAEQYTAADQTAPRRFEVSMPALQCGDTLEYRFIIDDSGGGIWFYPVTGSTNTATVRTHEVVVFADDFENDCGWTHTGTGWERGVPAGWGGGDQQYGGEDPSSGCLGPNVFGYNLQGDYPPSMGQEHLYSPVMDVTGLEKVHLRFYRWLGVDESLFDGAWLSVSTDGTQYKTVWRNSCAIVDNEWMLMDYDVSTWADGQSNVRFRWTMGSTNSYQDYCGWNIDGVQVVGYRCDSIVDADLDGQRNWLDNCPEDHNPGQEDSDSDGIGDACCCQGPMRGNLDESADGQVTMGDLTVLLDYLYISYRPLPCPAEADLATNEGETITTADLEVLLDHLFISMTPLPECP